MLFGWPQALVFLVAVQRLCELILARHNTRRLLAAGGVEHGAGHYPFIVLVHGAWLAALFVLVPEDSTPNPWLLAFFLSLQAARIWVIVSLGGRWTTRIVTVPGRGPIRDGPYRYLRHPNYAIVILEIAVLPLAFGAWEMALVFSLLNAAILRVRIRAENAAWAAVGGENATS
jgi:methyltransferase